jgi:hypothetical protein
MNKDELKELAATLNGIADGKAWECWYASLYRFDLPVGRDVEYCIANRIRIRLKPWSLPPPPDGIKWHRDDWTEEMLPEGYRPLLAQEPWVKGDEIKRGSHLPWQVAGSSLSDILDIKVSERTQHCRTKRPLPQPQQPDPYAELKAAHAAGKVIQLNCGSRMTPDWEDLTRPVFSDPLELYRIKPDPIKVPLGPDDIKAGDEFLSPEGLRYQWESVYSDGIQFYMLWKTRSDMMKQGWKIRSIGETEWRPCYKEVEA